jgi:hypothetical protein
MAVVVAIGCLLGADSLPVAENHFMRMLANTSMTKILRGVLATGLVAAVGADLRAEEPGFTALFDGKNP